MINVLSLFDGLSGARIVLDKLGIECNYYTSEVDKYAIQVSKYNYPDIIQLGDIKTIKGSDLPLIDLLIGGSPCQDLSVAKKDRQGLKGERSGLFYEYVRLLKEIKPRYFLLENVNSMPKESKKLISGILGVEPIMINSSLLSAQNRKRLYWVGKLVDGAYQTVKIEQPEDKHINLKDILEESVDETYIQDKPIRVGQIGKGGQGDRIYSTNGKSVNLSANGGGRGAKTGLYCIGIIPESIKPKGNYLPRERVFSINGKFRIVTTVSNQQPSISDDFKSYIRKLTPIECERLQTIPNNSTSMGIDEKGKIVKISNTQRYKMIGNGFTCDVIAHILKGMNLCQ